MPWISAAVMVGGSLLSSAMQSDASSTAADQASSSANRATDTQLQMFNTQNQQQAPYRQAGYTGLDAILRGSGLPVTGAGGQSGGMMAPPTREQFTTYAPSGGQQTGMGGLSIGPGGNLLDSQGQNAGMPGTRWVTDDVNAGTGHWETNGVNQGADIHNVTFGGGSPTSTFDQAGYDAALAKYNAGQAANAGGGNDGTGIQPGFFTHQFNANDLNANLAPNWQFALDQGIGATKNAGNLQTGLLSGNTMKGIADYTLNKSGDLYQNAFSNFTANQSNIFNRLSTIAGLGQAANTQSASLAGTLAPSIAGTIQNSGAAQAAGTVGSANALAGGASNALGWYQLNNMMKPQTGGTSIAGAGGGAAYSGFE